MHSSLEILQVPTAPHYEDQVAAFIKRWLKRYGISFREDRKGNLLARLRKGRARAIAFGVHMDHPGWAVETVKDLRIEARFLGGVPKEYFKRLTPVEFFDKTGSSCGRGHVVRLIEWKPKSRRFELRLESGKVSPGYFGMWRLPASGIRRGTHIVARACDDLAGCAAVLAMFANLSKVRNVDVHAIFTRREEIGLEGAFEVARSRGLPRSIPIISIETSKALANAPQGGGPIVRVGDRSSIFDPKITAQLCEIAQARSLKGNFRFQRKLMDGGTCEATAYLREGYRAGGLCVALGNYHNCSSRGRIASENIRVDDWLGLVELMEAVARKN